QLRLGEDGAFVDGLGGRALEAVLAELRDGGRADRLHHALAVLAGAAAGGGQGLHRPAILAAAQALGGTAGCWRTLASISQLTRNTAAITGPITKPLRPKTTMPPRVATSTR